MANFSIYNTLSSTYWRPVDFNVVGEEFSLKKTDLFTNNGTNFALYDFLENSQDFSINKKTCLFLTSSNYNSNIIENNGNQQDYTNLTSIRTPISSLNGGVIRLSAMYSSITTIPKFVLNDSNQNVFGISDVLFFNFQNNKVTIEDVNGNLLTADGTGENNLYFRIKKFPIDNSQYFDYILGSNNIALFQSDTNYQNIVIKNTTGNYILSSTNFNFANNIPSLNFVSYTSSYIDPNNDIINSFLVKYNIDPITSGNDLLIDEDYKNNNPLSQNYLGIIPIEYPTLNNDNTTYPIQLHGLKNYQTPEYTYSTGTQYLTSTNAVRRLYNKIYTGTNQNNGYDNVFLGYQSDTKSYQFKTDNETVFYYPPTSNRLPISASGLIQDGAVASNIPFLSDKVFILNKNYQETTPGSPQPPSIKVYNNTWLCSWLSGSTHGDKEWVDRYYNAAYYTLNQALTSKTLVYNNKYQKDLPYLFDVPSSLVFEPGVLYRYQRVGKDKSKDFLTYLDNKDSLILSITNWVSSPLLDNSYYKNNGLVLYADPENFKKTYFELTGKDHVVFPSTNILLERNELTCSIWVNVDDWNNVYGDQIIGNYYNSGFGLINEGSLYSPLITLTNTVSASYLYNLNYKFNTLSEIPLLSANPNSKFIIQRLPDYTYWIFDVIKNKAIHFNALNNIILSFDYSNQNLKVNQIEFDSNQRFYLFDKSKQTYFTYDSSGTLLRINTFDGSNVVNRIEIDKNNNIIPIYGNASVIDNDNNIWEVIGSNLYKNREVYANVGKTQQITCDSNNNIWLSHLYDTISILDTTKNIFYFSERIGEGVALPVNECLGDTRYRFLNFVKIPKQVSSCDNSISYQDALVLVDNIYNQIYLIDSNGLFLSKLNLRSIPSNPNTKFNFSCLGDFTGYQFLRKFSSSMKKFTWKFKVANSDGTVPRLYSLSYALSSLPPGWHNFVFTFNAKQGYARYYVDSIKVNEISTNYGTTKPLYYDYKSSLLLGAGSIGNTTFNDIIGIDDSYKFIGKVSELKIYNNTLMDYEVEQLYLSSNLSKNIQNLNWNMKVGNRNFIEEVAFWYKLQLPGSKSKYFNINVHNLNISDDNKKILETSIRNVMSKITPAETSLYKINWM
jgi:hypothetical protein